MLLIFFLFFFNPIFYRSKGGRIVIHIFITLMHKGTKECAISHYKDRKY